MTGKQRAYLRKLAQRQEPIVFVGKEGVTQALLTSVSQALEARELIKGSVQQNSELSARQACDSICENLQAEGISVVGRKFVIYKQAEEPKIDLKNI